MRKIKKQYPLLICLLLCLLFFVAYSVLAIVRHNNYNSFGYDLGINDQTVWKYSKFQFPVTTIDPFPHELKLAEHVELVYALIAPAYWIWDTRKMLLMVEAFFISFTGLAVFLLAREKKVKDTVAIPLVISYLAFYGVQYVMWFDTHSASYAAAFLLWFILFLEKKMRKSSILFFFLALTAKENIGLLTFFIALVYFIRTKAKLCLFFIATSVLYVAFIFLVFFPHILHIDYLYSNSSGMFSNLNPVSLVDTQNKRDVFFYSLLSFGFIPLLTPLYLVPALADLTQYFMIASELSGAQGLFGHYRVTLVPFLLWATIISVAKFKWLNKWYIGLYLIISTLLVQYVLHLPLSYLTKEWFWQQPSGVKNIQSIIRTYLPRNASVVAQNNIVPHVSHRDQIYSLYPEKKYFATNSPCGEPTCDWFRWYTDTNPEFLLVDTAPEWDARHLLIDREEFLKGLANIERAGIVERYQTIGTTILYRIKLKP